MGSSPSSTSDGELVLVRRPLDACSSSVDSEEDERRLPALFGWRPDVRVSVLRASYDSVGLRRPGYGRDQLVVLSVSECSIQTRNCDSNPGRRCGFGTEIKTYLGQGLGELPFLARLAVDLRLVVVRADHDL